MRSQRVDIGPICGSRLAHLRDRCLEHVLGYQDVDARFDALIGSEQGFEP